MKFLINEAKKVWNLRTFLFVLLFYILLNIGIAMSNPNNTKDNWRENAIEEINNIDHLLSIQGNDGEESSIEVLEKNKAEIKYALDNNIPYNILSVWNHLQGMDGMNTFLFLIVIVLCHKIISIEDESKTWKNLFSTGFGKKRVLLYKIAFAILQTVFLVIFYLCVAFIVGLIVYGGGTNAIVINYVDGSYVQQNLITEVWVTYASLIIKGLFYSSITIFLSSILVKNKLSLVIPIVILIGGAIINEYTVNLRCNRYLPFMYISMNAESILINNLFLVSTLLLSTYTVALLLGSIVAFRREMV